MSTREDIVSHLVKLLKAMNSPKLGKVVRDPIVADELPKTAFPAVYVETTNEDIEDVSMDKLRRGVIDVEVVVIVGGKSRDTQRNVVVEGIEKALLTDRTVGENAKDISLARVEAVAVGESAPYASLRMVFNVEHHYTIT
tara:strand:+ start:581 stop:1000 length:420 start_codon:yes stop_codon:yes gene_type:complete